MSVPDVPAAVDLTGAPDGDAQAWIAELNARAQRIEELEAERDKLAALLYGLNYEMHPTTPTTARGGGIGGMTITAHCDVIYPHKDWQLHFMTEVERALGDALNRDTENGTHRLGNELKKAKGLTDA